MNRWGKGLGFFAALGLILLMACSALAADTYYAYTKAKTPVYAGPSEKKKTARSLPAYTVLKITQRGEKYSRSGDGTYVLTANLGFFTTNRADGKVYYWKTAQTMYGTGNENHPLKTRLPACTGVKPLRIMQNYFLVFYRGTYGFVPRKDALTSPKTEKMVPILTAIGPDTPLYTLPFSTAGTKTRVTGEQTVILDQKYGAFYVFPWKNSTYYVRKSDVVSQGTAVAPKDTEAFAERKAALYSVPEGNAAKRIGTIEPGTAVKVTYRIGKFIQISDGKRTGFAANSAFVYPGGNGKDRYYLHLNKGTRTLTVYRADENGGKTSRKVLQTVVAIGRITTPTPSGLFTLGARESWHYFGPSYAPYAIQYTAGRYIHGPLYRGRSLDTLIRARLADFGTMHTGGCIRTPLDDVKWIYFHCAAGTTLEVVNGAPVLPKRPVGK